MMHDKIAVPGMKAPRVKGHMAIELYDAKTGELTHREELDNYVAEQWFEDHALLQQWNMSSRGTGSASDIEDARLKESYTSSPESIFPNAVPFYGLLLSDYGGAIDTTERIPKGVVCGSANKNYTASGTFSGSYNTAESSHSRLYHRFVYDFATTQGNGTIQSIYTGDFQGVSGSLAGVDPILPWVYFSTRYTVQRSHLVLSANHEWVIGCQQSGNSNTFYAHTLENTLVGAGGSYLTLSFPGSGSPGAATSKGSRLYWMTAMQGSSTSTSRKVEIYSLAWADVEAVLAGGSGDLSALTPTLEHTLDSAALTAMGLPTGAPSSGFGNYVLGAFEYIAETDSFLFGMGAYSGNSYYGEYAIVERSATDWSILNTFDYPVLSDRFWNLSAVPNEPDYVWAGAYLYKLNRATGTMTEVIKAPSNNNLVGISSLSTHVASHSGYARGQYGEISTVINQWFFSRVRLDNPVVKDNTNTMKVVYEFTIEDTDLFS